MQMLDYNVPGGKLNRGLAVGDILLHLSQDVGSSQLSRWPNLATFSVINVTGHHVSGLSLLLHAGLMIHRLCFNRKRLSGCGMRLFVDVHTGQQAADV